MRAVQSAGRGLRGYRQHPAAAPPSAVAAAAAGAAAYSEAGSTRSMGKQQHQQHGESQGRQVKPPKRTAEQPAAPSAPRKKQGRGTQGEQREPDAAITAALDAQARRAAAAAAEQAPPPGVDAEAEGSGDGHEDDYVERGDGGSSMISSDPTHSEDDGDAAQVEYRQQQAAEVAAEARDAEQLVAGVKARARGGRGAGRGSSSGGGRGGGRSGSKGRKAQEEEPAPAGEKGKKGGGSRRSAAAGDNVLGQQSLWDLRQMYKRVRAEKRQRAAEAALKLFNVVPGFGVKVGIEALQAREAHAGGEEHWVPDWVKKSREYIPPPGPEAFNADGLRQALLEDLTKPLTDPDVVDAAIKEAELK